MAIHNGFKHCFFRHFICTGFNHVDGILCTCYNKMHIALILLLHSRVNDKLAIDAPYCDTRNRAAERDIRNTQCQR
ncbi:Uncharacterised protein [Mycobacteroides abscessus subsp. abscessus]|nr:Uncharacterised protein [Mycobacteroides abscessus subsp. abscessus]